MKYFVLGAFSSAIFVYGIALTYGATGSTNLAQIAAYLANNVSTNDGLLLAGAGLLLVGFRFKVAAVPFHMWTPDVYQGAPTPATGFMAAIAKVGGFAALLRVFFSTFHSLEASWQPILWMVALLTLVTGAVLGLVQRDVKRMLAYSSINHAGFILLGLQAASAEGLSASLYYVFVYSFLVLGSFAIITIVGRQGDRDHAIESYRGLGRRQPVLALGFAIFLLAQAGAPFTTGFLAKLYVVEAAVQAHSYALAVVAMLTGAVAAAFYLRVVFVMYGGGAGAVAGLVPLGSGESPAERVPTTDAEAAGLVCHRDGSGGRRQRVAPDRDAARGAGWRGHRRSRGRDGRPAVPDRSYDRSRHPPHLGLHRGVRGLAEPAVRLRARCRGCSSERHRPPSTGCRPPRLIQETEGDR